ncbi:hypothetical protein Tsubulata_024602, partial [Turnera subulata]
IHLYYLLSLCYPPLSLLSSRLTLFYLTTHLSMPQRHLFYQLPTFSNSHALSSLPLPHQSFDAAGWRGGKPRRGFKRRTEKPRSAARDDLVCWMFWYIKGSYVNCSSFQELHVNLLNFRIENLVFYFIFAQTVLG